MTELRKIWIEPCEAARGIDHEFGTQKALACLIGEKFIHFLEAADENDQFRAEIPAFVAEIKTIFEPRQLAEYLETARQTEPFDPLHYDEEVAAMERRLEIRKSAAELLLVERARECPASGGRKPTESCLAGPPGRRHGQARRLPHGGNRRRSPGRGGREMDQTSPFVHISELQLTARRLVVSLSRMTTCVFAPWTQGQES